MAPTKWAGSERSRHSTWRPSASMSTSVAGLPTPPAVLSPSSSTTPSSIRSRNDRRHRRPGEPGDLRQVGARQRSVAVQRPQQVAAVRPPGIFRRRHPIRLFSRQTNPLSTSVPPNLGAIRVPRAGRSRNPRTIRARIDGIRSACARVHGDPGGRPRAAGTATPTSAPASPPRCARSATRSGSSSSSATAFPTRSAAATSSCCRRSSPCPRTSRRDIDKRPLARTSAAGSASAPS